MTGRRPFCAPQPPHPDAAQRAIKAELVRVTLAGDDRPELVSTVPISHLRPTRRRKARR